MSEARPLDLVLVWHMHQPDYRDYSTGQFALPWVYLHAIKDYTDMAGHLERHPGVRAVVNFAPVLLDQVEDYAEQFASGSLRDPLLALLARPDSEPLSVAERALAIDRCFHANHHKMVQPYPAYRKLHELFVHLEAQGSVALRYLSDQYLYDLLTWYHLAWLGETVRRESDLFPRLAAIGGGYTHAHRMELFGLIGSKIADLVPRYRRLAEVGKVELAISPHYHTLAPLLIDFRSAAEPQPGVELPESAAYPGGRERVAEQVRMAVASHVRRFGARPHGMWPSEGAVSDALLDIIAGHDLAWTASSESVLANSLRAAQGRAYVRNNDLYRAYRVNTASGGVHCFFRDERLSDLIGFQYANWRGEDAAANFVQELESIAAAAPAGERPVVSVILDGENAWEYYPYNAYYFFSALYERLEAHPALRTHSYRSYLLAQQTPPAGTLTPAAIAELPGVVAGSWVYGNFSTWIGSPDKNRAWDYLVAAKQGFDRVLAEGRIAPERLEAARRQLADCEGSDWFWWFGDYNPAEAVTSFDRLFRMKLANLYRELQLPAPVELAQPISHGGGNPEAGGTMRRAT